MNTGIKKVLGTLESIPRVGLALLFWAVLLVVSHIVTTVWFGIDPRIGFALWVFAISLTLQPFLVSVPEYAELVTINLVSGKKKGYKTGLHFRYPWEQVKKGNYINLRLMPMDREEDYPAKDGPKMHAKWQLQYRVLDAITYIGVGREAIEKVLTGVGSSVLSSSIARCNSEDAKTGQKDVEGKLQKEFQDLDTVKLYGVEIPKVSLADLDYEVTIQKVRATEEIARRIKKIAADIRKDNPKIKEKDALNAALIIHGNISKSVVEVEGEGGEALAALLIAMSKGGKS